MREIKILNTIKLNLNGKDLRSKAMKNLKMILEDNRLMFTYNKGTKSFYVMIDSIETANKTKEIYNAFNVNYELIYCVAYVGVDAVIDGLYVQAEEETEETTFSLNDIITTKELNTLGAKTKDFNTRYLITDNQKIEFYRWIEDDIYCCKWYVCNIEEIKE